MTARKKPDTTITDDTPDDVGTEPLDGMPHPPPGATVDDAARTAYTTATTQLRKAHPGEFDELRIRHMRDAGFPDWRPRPSKRDRDKAKIDAMIREAGLESEYVSLAPQWGSEAVAMVEALAADLSDD